MTKIYYKNPQTNILTKLTYKDFGAAPAFHMHQGNSIGIIPAAMGGLQAETNKQKAQLITYTGPLLYHQGSKLYNIPNNNYGIYYLDAANGQIKIGNPDWKDGAIPYFTEQLQLEKTFRQLPKQSTITFPRLVTSGSLGGGGNKFYTWIQFNYILPNNIQVNDITISGTYVIRQNGCYLFTSGLNYTTKNGERWGKQFDNKPSLIETPQDIKQSETEGWMISLMNGTEGLMSGGLRLIRTSATAQTTSYSYQSESASNPTSCVGKACTNGIVTFENLTLTFNVND